MIDVIDYRSDHLDLQKRAATTMLEMAEQKGKSNVVAIAMIIYPDYPEHWIPSIEFSTDGTLDSLVATAKLAGKALEEVAARVCELHQNTKDPTHISSAIGLHVAGMFWQDFWIFAAMADVSGEVFTEVAHEGIEIMRKQLSGEYEVWNVFVGSPHHPGKFELLGGRAWRTDVEAEIAAMRESCKPEQVVFLGSYLQKEAYGSGPINVIQWIPFNNMMAMEDLGAQTIELYEAEGKRDPFGPRMEENAP